MKKMYTLVLLFITTVLCAQTDSILFLGNSYTYTEDLPGKFASLAQSAGKSVFIDAYTPGGKQLSQHYTDPTSLAKIKAHKWNYAVLQEQSQMPIIDPNTTTFYANHLAFDYIKKHNLCTEVVIYMTWARQAGEAWLVATGMTHEQMAKKYEDFYTPLFKKTSGRVSAVGRAFHEATKKGINVYSGDGSHQNADGTYLAACVFFATIYKQSPVGLTFSSASTPALTTQLQQIAHDVVMKNMYEYNINKVRFNLSTSNIKVGESINFTEDTYMEPFPSLTWEFAGGSPATSKLENPSGVIYSTPGKFNVKLSITDACGYSESRTLTDTVKVESTVDVAQYNTPKIAVYSTYLNANEKSFKITGATAQELATVKVYSIEGKELSYNLNNETFTLLENYSGVVIVSLLNYNVKLLIE